ncbi:hypothetical protein LVJ94_09145 [Pendulispora rubella]|uniref:Uncharacterized protein n=1 Tax=Pendulispora rubella TaxID=2741070 RepID=A0ABZ2LJD2_9BACT
MTRSSLLVLLAAVGGAIACNAILGIEDVDFRPGADSSVDSGVDAAIDPKCEPSPRDDASVLRDGCGVFAAPSGLNDAAGTRDAPVKSVARAIELALAKRLPHVYLCAAPYAESLHIDGAQAHFNVGVYGGLACPGATNAWSLAEARASLHPATGMALRIENAGAGVTIEDIDFSAGDAAAPGESSVAGYVSDAGSVLFRRASFTAGKGRGGTDADAPQKPQQGSVDGIPGDQGGGAKLCECLPFRTSSRGGAAGTTERAGGENGSPGGALGGLPVIDDAGRNRSPCGEDGGLDGAHDGGSGTSGKNGAPGKHGVDAGLGTIAADGWQPMAGIDGTNGEMGQGGGGGRGGNCSTPQGGGGGCGGCGGTGAQGGKGGGASIALLVKASGVRLVDVVLTANDAGNGGRGADGTAPLPGGARGLPAGDQPCACWGGNGGNGGAGGSGGGGAGGLSVGLLYSGEPPQYEPATLKVTVGKPGSGGRPGDGAAPGRSGLAQPILDTKGF